MPTNELLEMIAMWRDRAEKAEAELASLKQDARDVAEFVDNFAPGDGPSTDVCIAANRVIEATKGAP